jgi:radical SAM superfamily enzyme with C-terminal helix-hairpin-helix motif
MGTRVIIIDGYVDEPAQFGVPPYISPNSRYVYGCYVNRGVYPEYYTIDQIRDNDLWNTLNGYDHLVLLGGVSVPGKYVGGNPLKYLELERIAVSSPKPLKIYHGPYTSGYTSAGGKTAKAITNIGELYDCPVTGNIETYLFHLLKGDLPPENIIRDPEIQGIVAPLGAQVIRQHPSYPDIINEIEVSTGCERKVHCSFCTEPLFYGRYRERRLKDILNEIGSLSENGAKYFRLGRAANIIAYGSSGGEPSPEKLKGLYSGIREICPDLQMLHTDNANPGYIADYSDSEKCIEIISEYNTPGDSLSFGVESFDETVIKMNNLGLNPEKVIKACEIVNRIGGVRKDGIPSLLPGINLLFGLIGETKATYQINFDYLEKMKELNLLIRRINMRKVMIFPNTPLYRYVEKNRIKHFTKAFIKLKDRIREEIDKPMLEKIFPVGTVIKDVIIEYTKGNISFGRKLGTYSILIGIREKLQTGKKVAVKITEHGYRSITGTLIDDQEDNDGRI